MSVPIVQLSEVAVVVSDLDRSVRFYTEVLGMAAVGARARPRDGPLRQRVHRALAARRLEAAALRQLGAARARGRRPAALQLLDPQRGRRRRPGQPRAARRQVLRPPLQREGRGPHRLRGPRRPPARVLGARQLRGAAGQEVRSETSPTSPAATARSAPRPSSARSRAWARRRACSRSRSGRSATTRSSPARPSRSRRCATRAPTTRPRPRCRSWPTTRCSAP